MLLNTTNQEDAKFVTEICAYMSELQELVNVFGKSGEDQRILMNKNIPCLFASGHKILNIRNIEGMDVEAKEPPTGMIANIRVKEGKK